LHKHRDIIEMQSGGWLVEDEKDCPVPDTSDKCPTSFSRCDSPPDKVFSG
jgi:hypothetical protein